MKLLIVISSLWLTATVLLGCSQEVVLEPKDIIEKKMNITLKSIPELDNMVDLSLFHRQPKEWGEMVSGVKTHMKTSEKKMALTFDACGGPNGSNYDDDLISFLVDHSIPATLFINEQWIHANEDTFLELASNPIFEIENHGTNHSPLSVSGGEAWGIQATTSPQEVYDEIMSNHNTVLALTGKHMRYFRSGTAYYDEVAVQLANELGYDVVNFNVLGDAGATYSSEQVKQSLLDAKEGSIVLLHMNQPQSGTAEGVKQAIPLLKDKGYEFISLKDALLQ